eukprot:CAMPEP_0172452258 /NCGR_PEP_ID=MMETSP1065-20121228/9981_1 /TAXON_ID=265537 /ORGANISM="Amphiprora paludosa, Strain CCMP125" /LENGTH=461 /DNA_ID=CAMNT_0013204295 /DNA_START=163 /DNA_END=1548 /DNA_ORIENTATION=-
MTPMEEQTKAGKDPGSAKTGDSAGSNQGEQVSTSEKPVETPSTTDAPPTPLCQFDRYWLQKLVVRHQKKTEEIDINDESQLRNVKIYASAPMVDQSDLPYRLQCRNYGTNISFTPMIHAKQFVTSSAYRKKFRITNTPPEDRPLIAQLCGGTDPETMLKCAVELQDYCDGIDINCGCPQGIAKRGKYGAFLLEQEETLLTLVKYLVPRLKVPLSVKVRLLPKEDAEKRLEASLSLYTRLVDAGIHLLTIHGRTRHQKSQLTGAADWNAIARAVEVLSPRIPVLANGSIGSVEDVQRCLQVTKADGIMSSEAILEYPPLFQPLTLDGRIEEKPRVGRVALAREYLELAEQYPPDKGGQGNGFKCVRIHMHRFLHGDLQTHTQIRDAIVRARKIDDLKDALTKLDEIKKELKHNPQDEELTWYVRHLKSLSQMKIEENRKTNKKATLGAEGKTQDPPNKIEAA